MGTYESVVTVLQNQNQLYGIPRLPQTPVDGDQKFLFNSKNKDSRSLSDVKKASVLSNYQARLQKLSEQNGIKTQKFNGVLSNSSGHDKVKSPLVAKTQESHIAPKSSTLSQLKSPPLAEVSKVDKKKTESKAVVNGSVKSLKGEEKVKEMTKLKIKEEKDEKSKPKNEVESGEVLKGTVVKSITSSKSKPPKIRLPDR